MGKAQAGIAAAVDPANPNLQAQTYNAAIATLRAAADKANQGDADAKARRAGGAARTRRHATRREAPEGRRGHLRDRSGTRSCSPRRPRRRSSGSSPRTTSPATSRHSDARIATFKQQFPNSTLMPLVLFRGAENAYAKAEALAKQNKPADAKTAFADAATKYAEVVAKFPEFDRVNRAKFGLALCFVAVEDWEKAIEVLEGIPAAERNGDLAAGALRPRGLPHPHRAREGRRRASGQHAPRETRRPPRGCSTRSSRPTRRPSRRPTRSSSSATARSGSAIQLAPGNERNEALNKARGAFERLPTRVPDSRALVGTAHLERAKVLALQGDKGNAINALRGVQRRPAPEVAGRPARHHLPRHAPPRAEPGAAGGAGARKRRGRSSRGA